MKRTFGKLQIERILLKNLLITVLNNEHIISCLSSLIVTLYFLTETSENIFGQAQIYYF